MVEDGRRSASTLEVPGEAEFASVARLFVASLARHSGCPPDEVEDLKMAVGEAFASCLQSRRDGASGPIRVVVRPAPGALLVDVHDAQASAGPRLVPAAAEEDFTPPGGFGEGSLGLAVIRALFADADLTTGEDGVVVHFTVPLEPA